MKIRALILSLAVAGSASAVTPLWLRDIKISPDGRTIAFTYKGDIYLVAAEGGTARRLTATPSDIETAPIWSPDSKMLAFASNHHGSNDVFTVSADGSGLRRLTSYSVNETPEAFSPDGKEIYFSAAIQDPASSVAFPSTRLTELYAVPVGGGAIRQVLPTPAINVSFAPDGKYFVYQDVKGVENTWRKHHTSSTTRDIWKYDIKSGKHSRLIDHAGEDLWPVVSDSEIFFLSERNGGSANVYAVDLENTKAQPRALTSFSEHPVRFLSRSAGGKLAFGYDGEIFTMAPGATSPAKVNINIVDADYQAPDFVSFTSGAEDAVASPDGKLVAFIHRGDLFVTSVEYQTTKQITSTAQAESSPSWADGGRTLYFVSDSDGRNDLYKAEMTRKDDPDMAHATALKIDRVLPANKGIERASAKTSPDGSKLAYIQNRNELMVLDLTTKKSTLLAPGSLNPERDGEMQFSWSPDGNWIVFTCVPHHHSPYYDIALVNADGNKPEITYITETGYFEEQPRFTPDGQAVIWASERYGMRNQASWGTQYDVMTAYLNRAARDKSRLSEEELALFKKKDEKKDSLTIVERDGIQDRIERLTPYSSALADAAIAPDGETLYYLSKVEKGYDLWKRNLRSGDISLVSKLSVPSAELQVVGKDLFIFSPSSIKKMSISGEKLKSVSFSGRQKIDRSAERDYMLEYVRTEEGERFYTESMHGVDWNKLVDHYRKFLPHINNNASFSEMLSEILGELNVSHTGSGYRPHGGADETTSNLGLIYDMTFSGPGWKVAEVVAGGPFDRADAIVAPGDIITEINSVKITPETDFTSLLNGLAGKPTLVRVNGDSEQVVKPITSSALNSLLYDRWVKRNAAAVDSLSNGRLGYVHIKSMADPSFRTMYADVLGKYNDREGIVIDTRWNGGGRMHEDIEVLFSGEQYLTQKVRGEKTATMPSRRWNKPSIMIIGEANYSNAHGTPWVYTHRGLGKTVGMPVPGTMTSVNWVDLIDDTMYFGIPVIGYELPDGSYLENKQLEPDVKVENSPERIAAGIDDQLRIAVETLLKDLKK